MTRREHLLIILMEECAEVAHRASKALRFTLEEVQPGQPLSNAQRLVAEMADLYAVFVLLNKDGALDRITWEAVEAKKKKVEEFLLYSEKMGTLGGGDGQE